MAVADAVSKRPSDGLSKDQLVALYRVMVEIREFDEEVYRRYLEGLVHGTTHLSQGQEAISAGVMAVLRPEDKITITHRSHGPCVARGVDMARMFGELMGRKSGLCKGQAGSMHLKDFSKGVIGSFAIVGAGIPVAVGAGLSAKLQGKDFIAATFFGDGSTNIGSFHEALNIAAVHKAPVVFICENNLYGEFSRIDRTTPLEDISTRAVAYAMPGYSVDGNDVLEVYDHVWEAARRARKGEGPTLLECKTYRHRGHSRTDPAKYRPEAEVQAWLKRDPIVRFRQTLIERGVLDEQACEAILADVKERVKAASEAAAAAPWPDHSQLEADVLA